MVKRKQNPSPVSIDIVRWGIIIAFIAAAAIISWLAVSSFIRHSGLFIIEDVVVDQGLGEINIPELAGLKGRNIFSVDLGKVQDKIALRYPQIAGLKLLRRFPDEISVQGERRKAFAAALVDGRTLALSRDGCFIGAPDKEAGDLVLIKGLQHQKTAPGTMAADPVIEEAFQSIEYVRGNPPLEALHLRSMAISDMNRIVFAFGFTKDPVKFEVVADKDKCLSRLKTLAVMVERTALALNEVKYIDLRFDPPVIGKKKVKK